jgi:predicted GIY-YIG superfamily endonuclease
MQGCYLLHFESKLANHAQHYCGWSTNLAARIAAHEAGNSAKLVHAMNVAGINFVVCRLWLAADRSLERQLKAQKNGPRLCPICQKKVAPGYSVDVKRALFEKAAPPLATHQGKRRPMITV